MLATIPPPPVAPVPTLVPTLVPTPAPAPAPAEIVEDHPIPASPCVDGVVSPGMTVTATMVGLAMTFVCIRLFEKGGEIFAFLQNKELKVEMTVPCLRMVSVSGSGAPTPPTAIRNQPSSSAGLIQYALSILKANLMHVTAKNVNAWYHVFDIIALDPALEAVFQLQKKTRSEFSVVARNNNYWDFYLGKRWDVLADGVYVAQRIVFFKKKISRNAKAISPLKLSCQIFLIHYVITPEREDVYREELRDRMTKPRATVISFIFKYILKYLLNT